MEPFPDDKLAVIETRCGSTSTRRTPSFTRVVSPARRWSRSWRIDDTTFNALYGHKRLYFHSPHRKRSLDVLVDRLHMCHTVEFKGRLSRMPVTLDPSDLLLEPGTIGLDRILSIVGNDWGWWRTVTMNLERIMVLASSNEPELVPEGGTYQAVEQLSVLSKAIEAAPKSLRWKARAKVGERVRWYEMPEETPHH